MAIMFQKAVKSQAKIRAALVGPSGSGKTYTALSIGSHMLSGGKRMVVIDSENGSASKYADLFDFDTLVLDNYSPLHYAEAINAAGVEGYGVIIIDSLSHAWNGSGGALEQVDKLKVRNQNNSFNAWREVTPMHNRMVEAILQSPGHVIVTLRAKTEYVVEKNERGQSVPRKIGLAPVQRDGLEYEFDVVADLDIEHNLIVSKTRCSALDNKVINKPGQDVAALLVGWLSDGEELKQQPTVLRAVTEEKTMSKSTLGAISEARRKRLYTLSKGNAEIIKSICEGHGYTSSADIALKDYDQICHEIEAAVQQMGGQEQANESL